jgi:uncharacterized membrane protein YccC
MDPAPAPNVTGLSIRSALASTVCLVVSEYFHLEHANLAVWTPHMVTAQYPFTAFQKGIERIVGRVMGVLSGLLLITLFRNAPLLESGLEALLMLAFYYVFFAGRLAYTFQNAGFYLASIVSIGNTSPEGAVPEARAFLAAIVVGVAAADIVMWLTGAEHSLAIHTEGQPLLPLNGDFIRRSLMLVVTVWLTLAAAVNMDLPKSTAIMSVMLLTIAPDMQSMIRKGELRILGAVLGTAWALGAFLILGRLPHFSILVVLTFIGMFIAAYITRASEKYSYAGLQMGLVLPMILVLPPQEFGDIAAGFIRLKGIVVAIVISLFVGGFWVAFPLRPAAAPAAPTPAQR